MATHIFHVQMPDSTAESYGVWWSIKFKTKLTRLVGFKWYGENEAVRPLIQQQLQCGCFTHNLQHSWPLNASSNLSLCIFISNLFSTIYCLWIHFYRSSRVGWISFIIAASLFGLKSHHSQTHKVNSFYLHSFKLQSFRQFLMCA